MVNVFCVFGVYCSLSLVGEGGGAGEGVVGCADYVGVGEAFSSCLWFRDLVSLRSVRVPAHFSNLCVLR